MAGIARFLAALEIICFYLEEYIRFQTEKHTEFLKLVSQENV